MENLRKLREKLSDNEKKYVDSYLKQGNKLKAYESVFKNAEHNRGNPYSYHNRIKIQSYISAFQENQMEKAVIDKAWVINRLAKNAELGGDGYEVKTTKSDGEEVITTKKDLSASNRASELLGKDLGLFTNEVNINGLDELVKGLVDKADLLASESHESEPE